MSCSRAGPGSEGVGARTTAEMSRVAGKVNKIKAGNLRASVLHEPCRQQQGGSVKDRAGGEDYSMCVRGLVCMCLCVIASEIFAYFVKKYFVTERLGAFTVSVCSLHTRLGLMPSGK